MKNVAIFGAGRIGRIHASNLAALPGVKLQAVCDPMAAAAAGTGFDDLVWRILETSCDNSPASARGAAA